MAAIFIRIMLFMFTIGNNMQMNKSIGCESNEHCLIICDELTKCVDSIIICPIQHECKIRCSNRSCDRTIIHAKQSTIFNLYLDHDLDYDLTLYLPINNTAITNIYPLFKTAAKKKVNKHSLDVATNHKLQLTLYAINGFRDIIIHDSLKSKSFNIYGTMYCQKDYNASCNIQSWSCIRPNDICSISHNKGSKRQLLYSEPSSTAIYTTNALSATTSIAPTEELIFALLPTIMPTSNPTHLPDYLLCNETCNGTNSDDDIHDTIHIDVVYTFSNKVIYNLNNMECFLYKIFEKYEFGNIPFDDCNIEITDINGGRYVYNDTFCEFEPCFYANEAQHNYGNTTMTIIASDTVTYNVINSISLETMENDFEMQFIAIFGIELDVTIQLIKAEHILWTLLKSIDVLWYIIFVLIILFCCFIWLLIVYMRRTHIIGKQLSTLDKESVTKQSGTMPPEIQKLKFIKTTALTVPSRSRDPVTPSVTTDTQHSHNRVEMVTNRDDYTGVRMDDDDSATDDDVETNSYVSTHTSRAERASLMPHAPVANVEAKTNIYTQIPSSRTAGSWHPQSHISLTQQQQQLYPQSVSFNPTNNNEVNVYKQLAQNMQYQHNLNQSSIQTHKYNDYNKKPNAERNGTDGGSSESIETIEANNDGTHSNDTEQNSQHFPSDDEDKFVGKDDDDNDGLKEITGTALSDDKAECVDDIKMDILIDEDMILSDIESESVDHLNVTETKHQPRQTTMEFQRNLSANILNAEAVMEDIVKDIAATD